MDLEQYRKDIEFIKHYREASNAATGSKVDSNANVENKNITTIFDLVFCSSVKLML